MWLEGEENGYEVYFWLGRLGSLWIENDVEKIMTAIT